MMDQLTGYEKLKVAVATLALLIDEQYKVFN